MLYRVLFIDTTPFMGGAQMSLRDLILHLDQSRFVPLVAAPEHEPDGLLTTCRAAGLATLPLAVSFWRRSARGLGQALAEVWRVRPRLRQWLREQAVDLVYANGLRAGLLAAATVPRDLPVIFHHRDFQAPAPILRWVAKRACRTMVVSDFLHAVCRETLGPALANRLVTVPNGVDPAELVRRSLEPSPVPLPPSPACTVALVADFVPWKRHGLFVRALAQAHAQNPQLVGLVVGGARDEAGRGYEREVRALADELGLAATVTFTGPLVNPLPVLAAARLHVSTAVNEPFGRTVLEALAVGCPVLATADSGGPVGTLAGCAAGRIVAPTPEALAAAMLDWTASPASPELAVAARVRAAQFTLAATVDGISAVLAAAPKRSGREGESGAAVSV